MFRPLLVLCCALLVATAVLSSNRAPAQEGGHGYEPEAEEFSAGALLVQAREALASLAGAEGPLERVDRQVAFNSALAALNALYQLHGCEWALPELLALRAKPDCPATHHGWSTDGRVELMLQDLELSNPEFQDYTFILCTITSNTALDLDGPQHEPLLVVLADGTELRADKIGEGHPLWPRLKQLDGTFEPQGALHPRTGLVFKQVFAAEKLMQKAIARVEFAWGQYRITVAYPENSKQS